MNASLDPDLAALLARITTRHPARRFPFIVTLLPGASVASVLPFEPQLVVEAIRMAAGEMTAGQAIALAEHAGVERIEFDGQVHALQGLADAG